MHARGTALGKRPDEHLPKAVQGPQGILAGSIRLHLSGGGQLHCGGAALHTLGADDTQVLAALAQPQGASCRKGSHLSPTLLTELSPQCTTQPFSSGTALLRTVWTLTITFQAR